MKFSHDIFQCLAEVSEWNKVLVIDWIWAANQHLKCPVLFLLGWKKRMLILHMSWNWCYIFSRLYIKCDFLVHSRNLTGFVSERGRLWMQFQVPFFHPALLRLCSTFAILGLVSAILISFIILCLLKYCSLFLSIKNNAQCTIILLSHAYFIHNLRRWTWCLFPVSGSTIFKLSILANVQLQCLWHCPRRGWILWQSI